MRALCCGGAMALAPIIVSGQAGDSLEERGLLPGRSIGQPPIWNAYLGAFRGADGTGGSRPVVAFLGGVHRAYTGATGGVLGFNVEPLLRVYPEVRAGARVMASSRAISLSAGWQHYVGTGRVETVFSWTTAVRRGGIVGHGSVLRLDWMPNGQQRWNGGFQVPLGVRAGQTRPQATGISFPAGRMTGTAPAPSRAVDSLLRELEESGRQMWWFMDGFPHIRGGSLRKSLPRFRERVVPLRDSILRARPGHPAGLEFGEVSAHYHGALRAAFALVVGEASADRITRQARHAILEDIILPVDATLGRVKQDAPRLEGLRARAEERFGRWLADSGALDAEARAAAVAIARRYGAFVEGLYRRQATGGARSRVTWIPPQFALLPGEHDEQGEIDALIERATLRAFTAENRITYVRSTEVQHEFLRTIRAAREYHVLWLHDFMGRRGREVDAVGFGVTVDGYLAALIQAVRDFDRNGRLPTWIIFLDQHFYDLRDGRLWMNLLERPLDATASLAGADTVMRDALRGRLDELRAAVSQSASLQAMARRLGGEAWLRSVIKVHVNITHPSDFSFRSNHIVPGIPWVPDNIMRDHRKLAFYDLREDDPNRGELLIAGAGVGAQYASATWDDRALLIRGPAGLEAKARARDLLAAHGIRGDDLEPALRISRGTRDVTPLGGDPLNVAAALQVHNEPGFGSKQASVARAMLYALMPPGSLIVVPDPLWLSSEWAGMLVGAALRGSWVYVIAPSILNAPSAGMPQISTTHDLLAELLVMVETLEPVMTRAGGRLRVGIFTAKEDVNDVRAQIAEVSAGFRRSRVAQEAFPFPPALVAATDSLPLMLELPSFAPLQLAEDALLRLPQLHQKTQFFATREAINRLVALPEWREIFLRVFAARIRQASIERDTAGAEAAARAYMATGVSMIERYRAGVGTPNTDVLYLSLGSQNQDPRGMLLDGEATVLVSGVGAVVAVPDFYYMLARSTWITNVAQLRRFYPEVDNIRRRIGRFIRYAL